MDAPSKVSNIAAAGRRLIGTLGSILAVLGRGTGPRREEMAGRSRGTDSQDLATILKPFEIRLIFDDLGPDGLSETSTSVLSQQQTSVLSQQQTSALPQRRTPIVSQQKTRQLPAAGRQL